jgi:hypothetical protein
VKKFEEEVLAVLAGEELLWSAYNRQGPCPGETVRIADIVFEGEMSYTVILEVDEDYHRSYTPECETVRVQQVREAFPDKPVFFIRYHPIRLKVKRGLVTNRGQISTDSKKQLIACIRPSSHCHRLGRTSSPAGTTWSSSATEDRVNELASKRESMQHEAMHAILVENKRLELPAGRVRWQLTIERFLAEIITC